MKAHIDLNADAGESYGAWTLGDDAALFPYLSSVNVACGFHAGDPLTMQATIALSRQHGLGIGAHPSYPDLPGFGRSAPPEDGRYTVGAHARAVIGHLERRGRGPVHLFGNSLGGAVSSSSCAS